MNKYLSYKNLNKNLVNIIYFLISITYLHFATNIPIFYYVGAMHDDAWFVKSFLSIKEGGWFGGYNEMTLIKGPLFSLFLYIVHLSHFSYPFCLALFKIFSILYLTKVFSKTLKNTYYQIIFFVVLLFFSNEFSHRIIRDDFNVTFLTIIFAFLAQTLFTNNFNYLRLLNLGILVGCFTLIREDGATSVFPIIIIFISLLFFKIKNLKFIILTCIWIILGISLPVNLYKLINFFKYGDFVGVELREKNYNNAIFSIYSIRVEPAQWKISPSNENLNAAYKVSPTLRNIKLNEGWKIHAKPFCPENWQNIYSGELPWCGSHFIWALRHAAADAGFYKNPKTARKFYKDVSDEINSACKKKIIPCANHFLSAFPNYESFDFDKFKNISLKSFYNHPLKFPLTSKEGALIEVENSTKELLKNKRNDQRTLFETKQLNMLDYYQSPTEQARKEIFISGWYFNLNNPKEWFILKFVDKKNGGTFFFEPVKLESPDVKIHFNNPNASKVRFSQIFNIPCETINECDIFLNNYKVDNLQRGSINNLFIDTITTEGIDAQNKKMYNNSLKKNKKSIVFFKTISNFYNYFAMYFFIIGVAISFFYIFIHVKNKLLDDKTIIIVVLISFIFFRSLFLLLTDYYYGGAINSLYSKTLVFSLTLNSLISFFYFLNFLKKKNF